MTFRSVPLFPPWRRTHRGGSWSPEPAWRRQGFSRPGRWAWWSEPTVFSSTSAGNSAATSTQYVSCDPLITVTSTGETVRACPPHLKKSPKPVPRGCVRSTDARQSSLSWAAPTQGPRPELGPGLRNTAAHGVWGRPHSVNERRL